MTRLNNSRAHSSYLAFAIHRISGLCLALFLPVHLYFISLLLKDPERLDVFLDWTSIPAVKLLESLLIILAGAHLSGGIRIIVYEWISESASHTLWISVVAAFSIVCGVLFLSSASI